MKHLLLILLIGTISVSCTKHKDHYKIVGLEIHVSKKNTGSNPQCVDFSDSTDFKSGDTIAIRLNFLREYYSTEDSPTKFMRYMPEGMKGCDANIESIRITDLRNTELTEAIFGIDTLTGSYPRLRESGKCQPGNCDCWPARSYSSISGLISEFNNQKEDDNRFLGSEYDDETIMLFYKSDSSKTNQPFVLKTKLRMTDGKEFEAISNELKNNP